MARKRSYAIIIFFIILGVMVVVNLLRKSRSNYSEAKYRILLVGASVGKAWNFSEWPERMQKEDYFFEMIPFYAFDKSEILDEVFIRPKRRWKIRLSRSHLKRLLKPVPPKPHFLILKECAAYFPGDMGKYKTMIKNWTAQCKVKGVHPVIATVIPVTHERAARGENKLKMIIEYNDWIKSYTEKENIPCLDLEAALRISSNDRALRNDLAAPDGLHLNKKAYTVLDQWLLNNLSIFFPGS